MNIAVYNLAGEKTDEMELDPYLFEIKPKSEVIHQVVVAQEKNSRKNFAHTKERSEIRGGGRKPWRQKGTGRARHGSIRSPLWVGGGITFGPRKDGNYSVRVNKKQKSLALRMVLSDKAKENNLLVVDKLELPEVKTKKIIEVLNKLPIKDDKTLIALSKDDPKLIKAVRNLKKINVIGAGSLNVVDLLKHKKLLISKQGLNEIEKVYGKSVAKEQKKGDSK